MRRRFPPRPGRPRAPRVSPALRRANALMERGAYEEAAPLLEDLARKAAARRGPRAPHLFLRAGKAYFLAKNADAGMKALRRGLDILARRRQWRVLHQAGERAIEELNEAGYDAEAKEIAAYLEETLPEKPASPRAAAHPALPSHCPGCGAPILPNEVEWLDSQTAECPYCGSPIRGES